MSQVVYIYGLFDPREQLPVCIRYVGKSIKPRARLVNHLCRESKKYPSRRGAWIAELRAVGVKPGMVVIEETDEENWKSRERHWIAALRCCLVNTRDGGQPGGLAPYDWSEEGLAVKSEFQKKRWEDPEYREKMAQIMAEREQDPEYVARHRAGISNPEWRKAHAESARARWAPGGDLHARIGQPGNSKPLTPEHKRKLIEGLKRSWETRDRTAIVRDPVTGQLLPTDGSRTTATPRPKGYKPTVAAREKMSRAQKQRRAREKAERTE